MKRRHLAGTEAEHQNEFIVARAEALEAASDAGEAMKLGQCLVAGTRIDSGYVALGRMQAHAYSSDELRETSRVHKAIRQADEPFEKACVRTEPASDTKARMAWARPGLAGLEGARSKPMTLVLETVRNPDFREESGLRLEHRVVNVTSLNDASRKVQQFISATNAGGGNWAGGEVRDARGKRVAYVSYNGRVWTSSGLDKLLEEAAQVGGNLMRRLSKF